MNFIKSLNKDPFKEAFVSGVNNEASSFVISELAEKENFPVLVVLPDDQSCEKLQSNISFFDEKLDVRLFGSYSQDIFKSDSFHMETASARIKLLYELLSGEFKGVVLTSVGALSKYIIPKDVLYKSAEIYGINEDICMEDIVKKLLACGYSRSSLVEEPGDFAVRGGILDFFSPVYENPVRLEFFGDTIDSIRFFSVNSQRKIKDLSEVLLIPVSEAVFNENKDELFTRIRKKGAQYLVPVEAVKNTVELIKTQGCFQGIEDILPLFYGDKTLLTDYFPRESKIIISGFDQGKVFYEDLVKETDNKYHLCLEKKFFALKSKDLIYDFEKLTEKIKAFQRIKLKEIPENQNQNYSWFLKIEDNEWLKGQLKSKTGSNYPLSPLADWIRDKEKRDIYRILVCSTKSQCERLVSVLKPYGISPEYRENIKFGHLLDQRIGSRLFITSGKLSKGFTFEDKGFAIVTEDEIFGAKSVRRKKVRKLASERVFSLNELVVDDVIVHIDHGIGRYKGLKKIDLGSVTGEFALVEYRDNDRLYIPVDRINVVQKYVGKDISLIALDKLGGKEFSKAKEKAKKKAEKIAKELLSIYAKREVNNGFSFTPPDDSFKDFESTFPYVETPGQERAIKDVLKDMTRPKPMDRLICGDVGYGKTEVAVRGVFKAWTDSRQSAVLVPTTVLAEQHYKTFKERFDGYPISIHVLNRFRTRKEQLEILKKMETGEADLVIGTHRLLQKDIKFASLGLLVVDEEQRFGVKHKEKIKDLRSSVDILTLTATPIPRTLHLSLSGIRDISIISTPPEARQPIDTFISEFDENIIKSAVIKELKRDGQVYFVHNNISTIDNICSFLQKLIPNVNIGKAHGRMPEKELEEEMKKFIHRETDILVCTTIVESGLDIPGANTMIVNRADKMGLSQLYQLRGRIGRGKEQGFAYLFVPNEERLTKDAKKRLKVLMQHSDLGAGFQLAMGDLQIRGAGDILGASQSGHVSAIGYDMFLKLLENAVSEIKGEVSEKAIEPEINIGVSAYIPESYIPDIDQRMIIYRRLSKLNELKELSLFKNELSDRYGKVPKEVENLLLKIMLRVLCIQCKVLQLDMNKSNIGVTFSNSQRNNYVKLANAANKKRNWKFANDFKLIVTPEKGVVNFSMAKKLLQEIKEHVNGI